MSLGMEVGLGPGHIVRRGPVPQWGAPPVSSPCLLWPNAWIDQGATWWGGIDLGPGVIMLDGDATRPPKGHRPPNFRPMSILATRLPISATAEHLYEQVNDDNDAEQVNEQVDDDDDADDDDDGYVMTMMKRPC